MTNQSNNIFRLCLIASISFASLSLIACGGNSGTKTQQESDNDSSKPKSEYEVVDYNKSITTTKAVSWIPAHTHENIRKIAVQGDNLVVMHRWHNGIINVPLSTLASSPNFSAQPIGFGVIETSGYKQPSSEDDYIVGAGENEIQDVWFANDNSAMYVLLQKPSADSIIDGEDSFGLFKVPVKSDGTLASQKIKGKTVYHRMAGIKRVGDGVTDNDLSISKALPLANSSIVTLDSNHNAIAVFSHDLVLDENNSFSLDESELETWTSNANNLFMLLKKKDGTYTLQQRKLNDLSKVFNDITVDATGYLVSNKQSQILALASGKKVTVFDNNLEKTNEFAFTNNTTSMSLSTDGKRLAVKTDKEGELVLIDITKPTPLMTTISLGGKFLNFTLADSDTLFVNYQKFNNSGEEIMTSGDIEKISLSTVIID